MQTNALTNNRQARRRIHIRPNLTIMKGTIADLKFIRYGDIVVPIIIGKERKRIVNHILPQGLNDYVNNLVTVNNNTQVGNHSISGWNSSSGNSIQLLNNGTVVQTLNATVIPVLNGSTVIWLFIANDLSTALYSANQVNLFASVNYINGFGNAPILQYSPAFNLATATTSIVKQSEETISFVWEIQLSLGSSALPAFILGILYSIPVVSVSCAGSNTGLGTFGGITNPNEFYGPYYFSGIQLQYIGGSRSANISSVTTSYDGTNTYLVMSASISLSSQVSATGVIVNVSASTASATYTPGFCLNGNIVTSGSAIQIPYNATLPASTITVTVTIEFSPAT